MLIPIWTGYIVHTNAICNPNVMQKMGIKVTPLKFFMIWVWTKIQASSIFSYVASVILQMLHFLIRRCIICEHSSQIIQKKMMESHLKSV